MMTDSGSSPFEFLQGPPYATYASPPDPSQLAMPVPMLGYSDFDFDLESLFPLLPSTSFFETSGQNFGTLISSSFPQDCSLPPVDYQSILSPPQPISKPTAPIEPCHASQLLPPFTYEPTTYVNTQLTPPPGPPPPTFTPGLHYENLDLVAGQGYSRQNMKRSAESELIRPAKKTNSKPQVQSGSYFTCKICGREFARQASLSQHQTVAHDGVRPFGCEFHSCTKRFTTSSNAKRHTKTHYNR